MAESFFPSPKKTLAIAVIAVTAVALASGTGLLAPVTEFLARSVATVRGVILRAVGRSNNNAKAA